MFRGWAKYKPTLTLFHSTSMPKSVNVLEYLQKNKLDKFDLEVLTSTPTADQLDTLVKFIARPPQGLPDPGFSPLPKIPATASEDSAESKQILQAILAQLVDSPAADVQSTASLIKLSPDRLKRPLTVDWQSGAVVYGDKFDAIQWIISHL
ncbi:hypothetical protein CANCADRAFT_31006 [Tortispora caseinolytica NRRL Y-17796]|uniref:Thioredoxin-like protein n=1 Tax=Tortispora caseinolytica NRRL Y-17796 TaxID=767744 RepID=A0A1E4TDT3_9ASCO|nr:hypothetical protein CANCADRAFT_31006 [Tortispora caseinolytica NRRL Y-17796]